MKNPLLTPQLTKRQQLQLLEVADHALADAEFFDVMAIRLKLTDSAMLKLHAALRVWLWRQRRELAR